MDVFYSRFIFLFCSRRLGGRKALVSDRGELDATFNELSKHSEGRVSRCIKMAGLQKVETGIRNTSYENNNVQRGLEPRLNLSVRCSINPYYLK